MVPGKLYRASTLCEDNKALKAAKSNHNAVDSMVDHEIENGFISDVWVLLKYRTATHYQSGEFLGPRFGDKIFAAVLIMSLYWDIGGSTDAQAIQSTASLLYFVVALCGYGAAAYVPSLTLDRPLFYRERADGCYSTLSYFLAKFLEEAVLNTATTLVFCVIVFYTCSFQGSFWIFVGTYYLTSMIGIVLAYAIASAVPTMDAANALLPTYVTMCMYFGGLFLLYDKIPVGWQWFSYTTFLRYAWCALMVNNFDSDKFNNVQAFDGKSVLEFYGASDGIEANIGFSFLMLAVLLFVFAGLGVLALKFLKFSDR